MARPVSAEQILGYLVTPATMGQEEIVRRSAMLRRSALAQIVGAAVLAVAHIFTNTIGTVTVLVAIGIVMVGAVLALWLAQQRRPVEGAWGLVVSATVTGAMLVVFEVARLAKPDAATDRPALSVIIFLWPVLVAGTLLVGSTVYVVALIDVIAFLLCFYFSGQTTLWQQVAAGKWDDSLSFLTQYAFSMSAAIGFVAYVIRQSARSLQEKIAESEQRAHEIMRTNEMLMEKGIQQVSLAAQLGVSATELSATSRQQASGAAEQASAISEVTSTIEEMGYTARQIAQSAENVAQVAEQTLEAVGRGQGAVDESVSAMEGIKTRVQELADKVLALGEHSQRIGEIIEIINNIADETHLLALNAAIESAGAGEHGRRFAVVAAEVKGLANRAMDSAKEVRGIIAEIQRATNASVMAAEQGLKEAERGVAQVYQAGRVMEEIVLLAQRTSEAAQEISLATTQQRTASEQIVETMREIAEVANQTAESSRQLADAATMLSGIAEQLQSTGQVNVALDQGPSWR